MNPSKNDDEQSKDTDVLMKNEETRREMNDTSNNTGAHQSHLLDLDEAMDRAMEQNEHHPISDATSTDSTNVVPIPSYLKRGAPGTSGDPNEQKSSISGDYVAGEHALDTSIDAALESAGCVSSSPMVSRASAIDSELAIDSEPTIHSRGDSETSSHLPKSKVVSKDEVACAPYAESLRVNKKSRETNDTSNNTGTHQSHLLDLDEAMDRAMEQNEHHPSNHTISEATLTCENALNSPVGSTLGTPGHDSTSSAVARANTINNKLAIHSRGGSETRSEAASVPYAGAHMKKEETRETNDTSNSTGTRQSHLLDLDEAMDRAMEQNERHISSEATSAGSTIVVPIPESRGHLRESKGASKDEAASVPLPRLSSQAAGASKSANDNELPIRNSRDREARSPLLESLPFAKAPSETEASRDSSLKAASTYAVSSVPSTSQTLTTVTRADHVEHSSDCEDWSQLADSKLPARCGESLKPYEKATLTYPTSVPAPLSPPRRIGTGTGTSTSDVYSDITSHSLANDHEAGRYWLGSKASIGHGAALKSPGEVASIDAASTGAASAPPPPKRIGTGASDEYSDITSHSRSHVHQDVVFGLKSALEGNVSLYPSGADLKSAGSASLASARRMDSGISEKSALHNELVESKAIQDGPVPTQFINPSLSSKVAVGLTAKSPNGSSSGVAIGVAAGLPQNSDEPDPSANFDCSAARRFPRHVHHLPVANAERISSRRLLVVPDGEEQVVYDPLALPIINDGRPAGSGSGTGQPQPEQRRNDEEAGMSSSSDSVFRRKRWLCYGFIVAIFLAIAAAVAIPLTFLVFLNDDDANSAVESNSGNNTNSSYKSFDSTAELQSAVDAYLEVGGNKNSTKIAKKYGWPINNWRVEKINNFNELFSAQRNPNAAVFDESLSAWNVSRATTMRQMFRLALRFNQNLSSWSVGGDVDMTEMFRGAGQFNQDLCAWKEKVLVPNNGNKAEARNMFLETSCPIQSDPTWKSSDYPGGTFCHVCQSGPLCFESRSELIEAVDAYLLNNSNTTEVAATYGWPIGSWCVGKVPKFARLFDYYRNKEAIYFNEPIGDWNTSNAVDMSEMFRGTLDIKSRFAQDISKWDVGKVKNMDFMFDYARSFDSDLSSWNVGAVTSMQWMFRATALRSELNQWNVSKVTNMEGMFTNARLFNSSLSQWDVSNVTRMAFMFYRASSFDQDLSMWNIKRVFDFYQMFHDASSFNRSLCDWGPQLRNKTLDVTSMFLNTSCPAPQNPNFTDAGSISSILIPPGPFCHICEANETHRKR